MQSPHCHRQSGAAAETRVRVDGLLTFETGPTRYWLRTVGDERRGEMQARLELGTLLADCEIVGVSRQNMRKLMLAHPGSFPAPVHEGSTSIWHLADVLVWLQARGTDPLAEDVLEVARVALQVNVAKEGRRLPRSASKELEALVG